VAQLIADGLTSRQIADRLVIAERTADMHVQNILAKLGCASRAQIAALVQSKAQTYVEREAPLRVGHSKDTS